MAWSIEFGRSAARYIKALDVPTRNRFREKLEAIQIDPFDLAHSKPLKERTERSARVGLYRILFEVDPDMQTIYVVHAGPRGQIYRD